MVDSAASRELQKYRDELRGLLMALSVPVRSNEAIVSLIDTIQRFGNVATRLAAFEARRGPEMDSIRNSVSEFLDACGRLPLKGVRGDAALEMIRKGCASELESVRCAAELLLKNMRRRTSHSVTKPATTQAEPAGTSGEQCQ